MVDEIGIHADRHLGQLLASGGPLISVRPDGSDTILRIATGNYGHLFDVRFAKYTDDLTVGQDVSFLGAFRGVESSREAYTGKIILIDGIALKPVGKNATMAPGSESMADAWLAGNSDVLALAGSAPFLAPVARPEAPVEATPQPVSASVPVQSHPLPGKPSAGVRQAIDAWNRLSPSERTEFLRDTGLAPSPRQ